MAHDGDDGCDEDGDRACGFREAHQHVDGAAQSFFGPHVENEQRHARQRERTDLADSAADVRQSINRVKAIPFLPHTDQVRGFVYDDNTGTLTEI